MADFEHSGLALYATCCLNDWGVKAYFFNLSRFFVWLVKGASWEGVGWVTGRTARMQWVDKDEEVPSLQLR